MDEAHEQLIEEVRHWCNTHVTLEIQSLRGKVDQLVNEDNQLQLDVIGEDVESRLQHAEAAANNIDTVLNSLVDIQNSVNNITARLGVLEQHVRTNVNPPLP